MVANGYMIAVADSISSADALYFPDPEEFPRTVFTSLAACMNALKDSLKGFSSATPVLYGEVFPFEGTTFEQCLRDNGHAFFCKAEKTDDNDDIVYAIGVAVVEVALG